MERINNAHNISNLLVICLQLAWFSLLSEGYYSLNDKLQLAKVCGCVD